MDENEASEDITHKAYEGWAIVELMGHRVRPGRVSEVEQYGVKQLRVDIPYNGLEITEFYGGGAIYAVRPCTKELAEERASRCTDLSEVSTNRLIPFLPFDDAEVEEPPGLPGRYSGEHDHDDHDEQLF